MFQIYFNKSNINTCICLLHEKAIMNDNKTKQNKNSKKTEHSPKKLE